MLLEKAWNITQKTSKIYQKVSCFKKSYINIDFWVKPSELQLASVRSRGYRPRSLVFLGNYRIKPQRYSTLSIGYLMKPNHHHLLQCVCCKKKNACLISPQPTPQQKKHLLLKKKTRIFFGLSELYLAKTTKSEIVRFFPRTVELPESDVPQGQDRRV